MTVFSTDQVNTSKMTFAAVGFTKIDFKSLKT